LGFGLEAWPNEAGRVLGLAGRVLGLEFGLPKGQVGEGFGFGMGFSTQNIMIATDMQ